MIALVCLVFVLIVAFFVNRNKRIAREKRNQDIFETELWQQLRIKAHRLADDYDWWRLGKKFVDACYAVHKFEWKEDAISRKNFPTRIKKYGYIKAIKKKPFYRGNATKWK